MAAAEAVAGAAAAPSGACNVRRWLGGSLGGKGEVSTATARAVSATAEAARGPAGAGGGSVGVLGASEAAPAAAGAARGGRRSFVAAWTVGLALLVGGCREEATRTATAHLPLLGRWFGSEGLGRGRLIRGPITPPPKRWV